MEISLAYLADLPLYKKQKLYELWRIEVPELSKTNCIYEDRKVLVHDVRCCPSETGLGRTGFEFLSHESNFSQLIKSEASSMSAVQRYLEETVALVKKQMGAEMVIVYDWRVTFYGIQGHHV
jgi:hypothetical protein